MRCPHCGKRFNAKKKYYRNDKGRFTSVVFKVGDRVFIKNHHIRKEECYGTVERIWFSKDIKQMKYMVRYGLNRNYVNSYLEGDLEILP